MVPLIWTSYLTSRQVKMSVEGTILSAAWPRAEMAAFIASNVSAPLLAFSSSAPVMAASRSATAPRLKIITAPVELSSSWYSVVMALTPRKKNR